ncbi:MAG: Biopolymer transport protein ExbB [Syntrophorhabdaceae bacterium PtaU1.Bin034]|nr:MAG: Biopolymer transport protein ExbB [Syntrophorhabdaceae bacterium PtaU1.Bin034]
MGVADLNIYSGGLVGLIYSSGPVAKAVVFILLLFSILSWTIVFFKWKQLSAVDKDGMRFLKVAGDSESFKRLTTMYADNPDSPFYRLLITSYKELTIRQKENQNLGVEAIPAVESVLKVAVSEETERLERRLSFLATTANTAPFIGLFGTVWGIMDSFREIGLRGTTSLAVVAPGISEALITTALGLATAIPAVLAYNYLINRLKSVSTKMEHASARIVNLINR